MYDDDDRPMAAADGDANRRVSPRRRDERDHYSSRKDRSRSPRRSPHREQDAQRHGRPSNRRDYDEPGYQGSRSGERMQTDPSFYDDEPQHDEQDSGRGAYSSGRGGGGGGGYGRSYRSRDTGYHEDEYQGSTRHRSRGDSRDNRPRSRSPVRSETLILDGLPDKVTEDDILQGLEIIAAYPEFSTDLIKSVRLRSNKRGRRIAFVEFFHTSDAADFLEQHPPTISLPLPDSRGLQSEPVRVGVNYSRTREDGDRGSRNDDQDWTCAECYTSNYSQRNACYKCKVSRPDQDAQHGPGSRHQRDQTLTGETDQEPQQLPSQYVVIRDLEPSVTEETLAKGVMKLFVDSTAPAKDSTATPAKLKSTAPVGNTAGLGARPGSLRRVFLVRDRASNETWRYGFAEFATLEDAQGAVAKYRASPRFTIASKPVIVAFIHAGVFVPVFEPLTSRNAHIAFAPIYNPALSLKYWDDRAYPSPLVVSDEPLPEADNADGSEKASESKADAANKKLKRSNKEKPASAVMAPQMQMWAKKRAELHGGAKKPTESELANEAVDYALDREATGIRAPHWRDTLVSYADRDSIHCLLCTKRFNTEQELRDHEVLSKEHLTNLDNIDLKIKAAEKLAGLDKEPNTAVRRTPRERADPPPTYISYADVDNLACLVCERKFKKLATLRLHERESELHRVKVGNEKNVNRAAAELAKLGRQPIRLRPKAGGNQSSSYRDRARERRVAFNQPKRPSGPPAAAGAKAKDKDKDNNTGSAPKKLAAAAAAPVPSKGASLLGKMGWTAGQGLGSEGTGRTEAIQSDLYMPGVGLGAEGGKVGDAAAEAARQTEGQYTSFVEKTKDKARERFEKLS